MKKIRFVHLAALPALLCSFICTGCSPLKDLTDLVKSETTKEASVSYEEKTYNEAVDQFFAAIDNRDKETIRSLFSPYIQETDADLDQQIDLLLKAYPGPTDICKRDGGMVHGAYESEYGDCSSCVDSSFPVVSNGTYYWCWFQLMYENDFDQEMIGITQLVLFSSDYFCALQYGDKDAAWPDTPGLSVCTDYPLDCQVRAIDGRPYKYTPSKRTLTETEAAAFLKNTNRYSAFLEEFGEPNAQNIYCIYELPTKDNKPYYLSLGIDEQKDTIYGASVVDDFGYIRTLWKEEE